ncbi:putative dehydrogenase [Rhypophila decipiens]|uniref:Dehydrogenase n=1 Tax=Rhypophila decipiens TaxID=261697 RepID=A0AAN6YIF0_9PEZI|nr:putative dehydrogenase [Rhypophila decipiens]
MGAWSLPSTAGRPVTVLGGGVLGRRISACWASKGFKVHIFDTDLQQTTGALEYIKTELQKYNPDPAISPESIDVRGFQDLAAAVSSAWLVIECVPEKLNIKIDVFADLEKLAPSDAILASNSSSYKSREMTTRVRPETARRILNTHYIIPPGIRSVELMTSGTTYPEIFPFLQEQFRASGMLPVVAHKESTGFIINRVWAAVKRECLMVLSEGVASPSELDSIWTEMFIKNASPPCAMMDSVGLDTVSFIEQHYIDERQLKDPGVIAYLQKYIDEGRLGAKSSKGGLYPPGHTIQTKQPQQQSSSQNHDAQPSSYSNINAPSLYILDIGLSNEPLEAYTSGRILVGSADGSTPLRTVLFHQKMPDGIAVCSSLAKIIWTNMGIPSQNDGAILSCDLSGANLTTIIPPGKVHTPKQIAIDEDSSSRPAKMYFSDREGMRVFRCNIDGSCLETLIQTGDWTNKAHITDQTRWCVGITVAPREKKFYWTQKGPSKGCQGRIFRAGIDMPAGGYDATNRPDIECLFDHLPEPIDLEIDEDSKTLYWTDRGELPRGNSLNCAVRRDDGSYGEKDEYKILARNLHEAIGLAVDKKNKHIYVADLGGSVYRFNLDGGERIKFYEDQGSFSGIALCNA